MRSLGIGPWAPRQPGPRQRGSPPHQVSVLASCRPHSGAGTRGTPTRGAVGAARGLLAPQAARECPLLRGAASNPFGGEVGVGGRVRGVSRELTRSSENKGTDRSIKMNFLKQFPASKLKCNPPFNSGREGSERAGNGMTFFPWVRRPTAKFFHCVVYVPHLAFKRLEIIWI